MLFFPGIHVRWEVCDFSVATVMCAVVIGDVVKCSRKKCNAAI